MPNYINADQTHIITDQEMAALYNHSGELVKRCWIIIHWLTGARPAEVIILTKKDITIEPEKTTFRLQTKKLGNREKREFYVHHRTLILKIPSTDTYIKTLDNFLRRFNQDDTRLFSFTLKTGFNIISKTSMDALGFPLCPYNFRHSRMTTLFEKGMTIDELKRFKGSHSDRSVREYIHARKVEYNVETTI
jgi:integrase